MTFQPMQLKVCEGCGSLWIRRAAELEVYCCACVAKLADFPKAGAMRRPGRKKTTGLAIQAGAQ